MREQRLKLWQQWRRLEKRIRAKDELYDVNMLRGYHCKNDGYGELLPCFSKQIAEVLNLHKSHKVVDVGSGIGLLCFDLACISGCNVKGIEIRRDIFLKSVQIAKHISERMDLDVSFVYGDGTADTIPFRNMDVIICCNTLWSGENNYRLLQKLCLQMRPGTRVVVLEQLGGQRYHAKSPRQQNDILSSCFHVPPQKYMSQPESVSWTSNPIPFYVYTKKAISREMKDRLEKDRAGVLRTPKHRTDPHVAEMAGKKRTSQEVEEEVFVMPRKRTRKADVKKDVVEISDDSDSEMDDSEDSEIESEVRVTRSAAKSAEAKVSKPAKNSSARNSRNSRNSRTSGKKTTRARTTRVTRATPKDASESEDEDEDEDEEEKEEEEDDESVTITAKKRKKRVVGVITSRIRKRTRAAIAKRQQQQQQRQQKLIKQQKQKQGKEEKQPIEEEEQRLTRSQVKVSSPSSSPSRSSPRSTSSSSSSPSSSSLSSNSSSSPSRSSTSPSFPSSPSSPASPHSPSSPSTPSFTTRSQVSSSTQFSSLPTIFRATKKSPQQSFDKEVKAARKWSSPESEGKVSERRSQRFKKFNMNLNDFIA